MSKSFARTVMAAGLAGALGLTGMAAPALAQADHNAKAERKQADNPRAQKGQRELAKMLEGRVAGEPKRCIGPLIGSGNNVNIIDRTALVYRQGDTIWVNVPQQPQTLDDNDILVSERFGSSQMCRLDRTYMIDRLSGMYSGPVFLGDFVPYRTPESQSDG